MNEYKKSVAALIAAIAFGIFIVRANARVTTANSTDIWAVGPSGSEVAVDSSGNLIPTTDNAQTLGTAALRYSNIYGAKDSPTQLILVKTQVGTIQNAAGGLYITSGIPPTSSYIVLLSSSNQSPFKLTSTPTIATTTVVSGTVGVPDGMKVVLITTSTVEIVLQDNSILSGTQLSLNTSTTTISSRKSAEFIFNATDSLWHILEAGASQ